MKVLWLGHFVPWPPSGGSLIRSHYLLREAARGAEVALLCLNQRALLPDAGRVEQATRALGEFCASVEILPIPVERVRWPKARVVAHSFVRGAYDEVWLRSGELAERLRATVASFAPDVVHFDTVGLAPYADRVSGPPLVLNHHNVESHMMRRRAERETSPARRFVLAFQARRIAALEAASAPRFAAHLAVSGLDRERLQERIGTARIEVVPNGVDLGYFRPLPDDRPVRPRSLVFVGGLTWYPNLDAARWLVREILPRVRARHPDCRLTLVGRHPPPEITALAAADPLLEVTGFVEDIRPHVARAAVYVCPMRDGGGTRLKILDALAQRVPLVGTRLAFEGVDVVSGTHALVADDAEGLAAAIGRVFDDPAYGRKLADAGRRLVEDAFGWAGIGERLREVYRSLAAA